MGNWLSYLDDYSDPDYSDPDYSTPVTRRNPVTPSRSGLDEQVVDQLITHQDAARERGSNILNKAGKKIIYTIDLSLLTGGSFPDLLNIGGLLEVVQSAETWRGQIMGSQIKAEWKNGALSVNQRVTVERAISA